MLLVIKTICKECYIKKHGELPTWAYGPLYQMTDEEKLCEICGKKDFLVISAEPKYPKE